jgi:hypothetical protein
MKVENDKPQKNPGGCTGYVLTPEDRQRGAVKAAAKRTAQLKEKDEQRALAGKVAALSQARRGLQVGQAIEPPANVFEVIQKLGELRIATLEQAGKALGVNRHTFRDWLKTYPEIAEAWAEAKGQEHDALVDKLMRAGLGELSEDEQVNIVALIVALKMRHGYRDQGEAGTRIGTQNNVQIVLPGAQGRDEYLRRVTSPAQAALPAASVDEGDDNE